MVKISWFSQPMWKGWLFRGKAVGSVEIWNLWIVDSRCFCWNWFRRMVNVRAARFVRISRLVVYFIIFSDNKNFLFVLISQCQNLKKKIEKNVKKCGVDDDPLWLHLPDFARYRNCFFYVKLQYKDLYKILQIFWKHFSLCLITWVFTFSRSIGESWRVFLV